MADSQERKPEINEEWLREQKTREAVDSQCFVTWEYIESKKREEWKQIYDNLPLYAKGNPYLSTSLRNNLLSNPDSWASKGPEHFVKEVASELQKKGIPVDAVTEKRIVEFLVDKEVPRSSAEHFIMSLARDLDPSLLPRTPMEDYIREEAERKYDANYLEKGANLAATWGYGASFASIINGILGAASNNSSDKYLEEQKKQAVKEVEAAKVTPVKVPMWMLGQMNIPRLSEASDQTLENALKWAQANAVFYGNAIEKAVQSGQRIVNIEKVPVSPENVGSPELKPASENKSAEIDVFKATVRCKEYSAFCDAIYREQAKRHQSELLAASAKGIEDEDKRAAMLKQIDDFQKATGYVLQVKDGHLYYPGFMLLNGKDIQTLPDGLEVNGFLNLKGSNVKELPRDLRVKEGIYMNDHDYVPTEETRTSDGYLDLEKAGAPVASMTSSEPAKADEQSPEAKRDDNGEKDTPSKDAPNFDGWNSLAETLGYSGLGDSMSHLGSTLAHLPDLLTNVLNGKSSIGLNAGTLIPLAAIIFGMNSSNPLLKFSLIALGATNLINKAGKETLSKYRDESAQQSSQAAQQTRYYKKYEDEELNPRITQPHVEGNVLIADIDRTPHIFTMPPAIAEAYHSGAIPLNTLANRVLEKTERMQQMSVEAQQAASQRYEQSQERDQWRGIK